VAPPGAGKGTVIGYIAVGAAQKQNKTLISVHKRDLIAGPNSLSDRLTNQFNWHRFGYYLSGKEQVDAPIMLGTVQTMIRRKTAEFKVIIIDECHRVKTGSYQKLLDRYPDSILLGFTATPFRYDKKGFADDFDEIIQMITYNELVKKRSLVPTRVIAPRLDDLRFEGIKTRPTSLGPEYKEKDLMAAFDNERVYKTVVDKWREYAKGPNGKYRKTIVFNVNSKEHSRKTAEAFQAQGIDARYIDSDTPTEQRNEMLKRFENNEYPVLCNIGLFTEGLSIDDVSCIVFNVATASPTKWVQAGARGSRPVWGPDGDWKKLPDGQYAKQDCLILDFGLNAERHGFIDDYDAFGFTLQGTPPKMGEVRTKDCPQCNFVWPVQVRKCKECGYEFPIKKKEKSELYADEAEWRELERKERFIKQVLDMPYKQLVNWIERKPEYLRSVGKIRGYSKNWPCYMAYKLSVVKIEPTKKRPQSFGAIHKILGKIEQQKGTSEFLTFCKNKFS